MTDACLICGCEPIEPDGWIYDSVRWRLFVLGVSKI